MLELIMTLGPATITSLKVGDAIVAGAIDWLQSLKTSLKTEPSE